MPKLTHSVDEKVVRAAKRYAAAHGTSVSRLVERYLDLMSRLRCGRPSNEDRVTAWSRRTA